MSAQNPVAVVTGAGSGIGAAIAALLRDRGWTVASISREPAPDTDLWIIADVADEKAIDDAVAKVHNTFGRIDAAVICAGHYSEMPALDIDQDSWERMLRVHVGGLAHVCRAVLPDMRRRGSGRIVGIASERAIGGGSNDAHYAAAKAAALSLLRSIAVEVAADGILVNAVAPGPCDTPLLEADSWERAEGFVSTLPARRIALPTEVAELVRGLLEEDVFLCGEVLSVNSGTVI
ncbi:2-hydroxycyclohexanecarboxyl-CoA dehydrogenase [Mycobacterium frederiksbergense]|uniref:2-hydroxycyclohexanecarboxyl-CoA dehydrogenase n=1 Tax=Mycolicibacterium frederiksbergense TaxID=117567 RepID=A0ABT6KW21_9MYCO|nr:SDR family oxidoreductase [Mycolicibacterium frederiksbergense]MDH6194910.1 2-hydroxycyclohexanecarboxyl-CoA dehydrogenase [Mycolicibacterium frederiksbergense]